MILPGATLGVVGGGQLGRMFVHAAQTMGYFTAVLDADPSSPAGLIAHHHLRAGYLDDQALAQLAQRCDAITTEFENVPAKVVERMCPFEFGKCSAESSPRMSSSLRRRSSKGAPMMSEIGPAMLARSRSKYGWPGVSCRCLKPAGYQLVS